LLKESGLEIDERYFPWLLSRSFGAYNGLYAVTPGCTGGYSYKALSEPVVIWIGVQKCMGTTTTTTNDNIL
jgi:hypothetical protein